MEKLGNIFILGDSYSTFEGFIPQGYAAYYVNAGREQTDVDKVEQTWWHQLLSETNSEMLMNCSYSGTTICNTGYNGSDCSNISFIARLDKLIADGYFMENKADTFFIFGGTNDSWADSPIGELKYSDWQKEDLYSVLPAFGYLLHRINEALPDARVICIINTGLKPAIEENFRAACEKYVVDTVVLNEIDKKCGHPTIKGMDQIKDQIKDQILEHLR